MQRASILLDGDAEIHFDDTVKINNVPYADNCDKNLIDFVYDSVFNGKDIIEVSTVEGCYYFPASKIILIKQYNLF